MMKGQPNDKTTMMMVALGVSVIGNSNGSR